MNFKKIILFALAGGAATFLLNSCKAKIPNGAVAVQDFDASKYLGKWYEIARFDYRFERNLNNVTADYSLNEDGSIKVLNRGYNTKKEKWEDAEGEARFVGSKTEARLKVAFMKPFWSGYNVIDHGNYQHALVAGDNLDYLWILSRSKEMPQDIKERFLRKAESLGYKTDELIWVHHD